MTSFGATLKNAREAKGFTCSQVAAKTRLLPQIVEDMENEDFHRIAAPIYGRGFVRLFAECVGLDPQPLIKEFMDLYEGRRSSPPKAHHVPAPQPPPAPAPAPAHVPPAPPAPPREPPRADIFSAPPLTPQPAPAPVAPPPPPPPAPEPDPQLRGLDLFDPPAPPPPPPPKPVAPPPPAAPSPVTPPPRTARSSLHSAAPHPSAHPHAPCPAAGRGAYESPFISDPNSDVCPPSPLDRFRSGMSNITGNVIESVKGVPRRAWRIAALSAAVLVVLALIVWGCGKLYSVTSTPAPVPGTAAESPAPAPAQSQSAKPAAPATLKPPAAPPKNLRSSGHSIPSLYAD